MKSGAENRADDDLDLALAYLTALGGDDPTAVTSLVTESFRNEHHAVLGSGCTGRAEYAGRLPGFFASFPDRRYDVVETTVGHSTTADEGTEVVVNYRFSAAVAGIRLDIPGVMWISVRGGLVSRRLDCWDSLAYHRQTGTVPSMD